MKKLIFGFMLLFTILLVGCSKEDDYKMSMIAPSGAPAMAAAELATTYKDDYTITMGLEASSLQTAFVNKENDVIIAPINLGANMYSKNQNYVLAAVLTWGNLFFASQKTDFKLEDMDDADVIFFGEGTVNAAVVNYVLKENDITPKNIQYLGSTQLTQEQLLTNENAIVLVAEPALTVAKTKDADITSISVQELYVEASGENGFPQAGCFINTNTIKNHKSVVEEFLDRLEASANLCETDTSTVAGYAENLNLGGKKAVLTEAIPNCNIKYTKAKDAKASIEFAVTLNPKLFGGAVPQDEFYYE